MYGTVYAYERMTWTNQARMRLETFISFYFLKGTVDVISTDCPIVERHVRFITVPLKVFFTLDETSTILYS